MTLLTVFTIFAALSAQAAPAVGGGASIACENVGLGISIEANLNGPSTLTIGKKEYGFSKDPESTGNVRFRLKDNAIATFSGRNDESEPELVIVGAQGISRIKLSCQ